MYTKRDLSRKRQPLWQNEKDSSNGEGCQTVYFCTKIPILENLGVENVHFLSIRNILRPFGIFYATLVYFCLHFPLWYVVPRKNLATLLTTRERKRKMENGEEEDADEDGWIVFQN
jgi:hypothetical protein